MELDDFKEVWKKAIKPPEIDNNNIMDIIHNKRYGPVAELKKRFRKQFISITLAVLFISMVPIFSDQKDYLIKAMIWFYIVIWTVTAAYFLYSYLLLRNLEAMDKMVMHNIKRIVVQLEKLFRWRLWGILAALVISVGYCEALMHRDTSGNMHSWSVQPLIIRIPVYILSVCILYFISKLLLYFDYGRHIKYLKDLIHQEDEG